MPRFRNQGVLYECFAVPGQVVMHEADPSPDDRCLGGKESWGTCENGEYLCQVHALQNPTTCHTIFNVQSSRYFEWQVRYHAYFFKKSGQEGALTRLLSASNKDHLYGWSIGLE